MEIERKWLIKSLPSEIYRPTKAMKIYQGYINTDPEVRIRKSVYESNGEEKYYLAIKSNGSLSRMEVEINISRDNYESLLKLIEYKMIKKDYIVYDFAGYNIEMSRVDDDWYYAEVEFDSEEKANNFTFPFPDLMIKEVTHDSNYKMKNYWKSSRCIK